jgi:hypothetical protein
MHGPSEPAELSTRHRAPAIPRFRPKLGDGPRVGCRHGHVRLRKVHCLHSGVDLFIHPSLPRRVRSDTVSDDQPGQSSPRSPGRDLQMCEPPSPPGDQDELVIDAQNVSLAALVEQMHQNWDRGDNAANDDLVVQIREHIRRHQAATPALVTGSVWRKDRGCIPLREVTGEAGRHCENGH